MKEYKKIRADALKLINDTLYALLNTKMLNLCNKTKFKNKNFYVNSALVEITNGCNFRCPHCYVEKQLPVYLDYKELIKIANDLKDVKCNLVTFTGGEIFTHKDFVKIYEYFYNLGFIISLNTNGYYLNEKIIDTFRKYPPCKIEISLYGNDNDSYFIFTKTPKAFDVVSKNINILKKLGIKILLKNVVTKTNEAYFNKIKESADKLGCKFKFDYIAFPKIGSNSEYNPEQIDVDKAIEALKTQKSIREHYISLFSRTTSNNKLFKCKINDDSIFITSNKKVCMCVCMQSYGVEYTSLKDNIYELSKIKDMTYNKKDKCHNCKYISLCRYCPGKFQLSSGSLHEPPEWFCKLGQEIYTNFVKGFNMILKNYLDKLELQDAFNIVSSNMYKIGFNINKDDEKIWKENTIQRLKNPNSFFYLLYNNGKICGYTELFVHGGKLIVSEIELRDEVKNTRILYRVIQSLINDNNFKSFDRVYFNINNKNIKSIKTFQHLGGKIFEKREKSSQYCLMRNDINNYLKKVKI